MELLIILVSGFCIFGYFSNIVKLISSYESVSKKTFRLIGIWFLPLGALMGFL